MTKTKEDVTAEGCLIFLLSAPVLAVLNGWAFATLWGWFLVPFGFRAIGWMHACGIMLMVRYATVDLHVTRDKHKELYKATFAAGYVLIAVGFGWIYHALMVR